MAPKKNTIVFVLAVTVMLATFLAPVAYSAPVTTVEVRPKALCDDTATPGSMRTFTIEASKFTNLGGYGVVLQYKPEVLQAVDAGPGPVFASAVASGNGFSITDISTPGIVQAAFTFLGTTLSSKDRVALVSIDFMVTSASFSWLLLESAILASPTGEVIPGVEVLSTFFDNDPATLTCEPSIADLSERAAWPEAERFFLSRESNPDLSFFAHATNTAPVTMVVRVRFTVVGDAFGPAVFESGFLVLAPGASGTTQTQPGLGFNAASAGPGRYFVSARAFFSTLGVDFLPGIREKTFSFAVAP